MPVSHSTVKLSKDEKGLLLSLAIRAIKESIEFEPESLPVALLKKSGAFVSLHKDGELRGCVGYLSPNFPLYQAVIKAALAAAYGDNRFEPLAKEEMNGLEVEISVLTDPEKIVFESPSKLLNQLTHEKGVIIQKGPYSATFLPQVWEQIPDREEFLAQLCIKAGLLPDAWKENADIYIYYADVFSKTIE